MRHGTIQFLICAIVTCVAAGCTSDQGPKRYRVSGEITFDGKPVPHGEIVFTPDIGKGNSDRTINISATYGSVKFE